MWVNFGIVGYGGPTRLVSHGDIATKLAVNEALRVEGDHFVDCIKNHKTPQTAGQVGLRVVELLEAATRFMRRKWRLTRCCR